MASQTPSPSMSAGTLVASNESEPHSCSMPLENESSSLSSSRKSQVPSSSSSNGTSVATKGSEPQANSSTSVQVSPSSSLSRTSQSPSLSMSDGRSVATKGSELQFSSSRSDHESPSSSSSSTLGIPSPSVSRRFSTGSSIASPPPRHPESTSIRANSTAKIRFIAPVFLLDVLTYSRRRSLVDDAVAMAAFAAGHSPPWFLFSLPFIKTVNLNAS